MEIAFPIARVENYPSDIVGAGFEPDAADAGALPRLQGAAAATAERHGQRGHRRRHGGCPGDGHAGEKGLGDQGQEDVKKKRRRQPID